jgi:hypothetical protein
VLLVCFGATGCAHEAARGGDGQTAFLSGALMPRHARHASAADVSRELPDWRGRVGRLDEMFAKLSSARLPDDVRDEMNGEFSLIRNGLVALKAELGPLAAVLDRRGERDALDVSEIERVARFEGLLRRTEARVFAIMDSFLGH